MASLFLCNILAYTFWGQTVLKIGHGLLSDHNFSTKKYKFFSKEMLVIKPKVWASSIEMLTAS